MTPNGHERKEDRKLVKTVRKSQIYLCTLSEVVEAYKERIDALEESIRKIEDEDKMERAMRSVEQQTKIVSETHFQKKI